MEYSKSIMLASLLKIVAFIFLTSLTWAQDASTADQQTYQRLKTIKQEFDRRSVADCPSSEIDTKYLKNHHHENKEVYEQTLSEYDQVTKLCEDYPNSLKTCPTPPTVSATGNTVQAMDQLMNDLNGALSCVQVKFSETCGDGAARRAHKLSSMSRNVVYESNATCSEKLQESRDQFDNERAKLSAESSEIDQMASEMEQVQKSRRDFSRSISDQLASRIQAFQSIKESNRGKMASAMTSINGAFDQAYATKCKLTSCESAPAGVTTKHREGGKGEWKTQQPKK